MSSIKKAKDDLQTFLKFNNTVGLTSNKHLLGNFLFAVV